MVMWLHLRDRRLKKKEAEDMPKAKACLACGALLHRMAERMPNPPYQWIPNGYICSKCNVCYMGVL